VGARGGVFGDSSRFHDPDDASIDYEVAASMRYVAKYFRKMNTSVSIHKA